MTKLMLLAGVGAAILATPAFAEEGDVLVRARAIVVAPNESSGAVSGIPGSKVGVGDSVMPEVDFTYMTTNHIGAELIVARPSTACRAAERSPAWAMSGTLGCYRRL